MPVPQKRPVDTLERLFHEPNRLSIVSALVGSIDGLTFQALKQACGLTDGNLSRHLQTLENAGIIDIKKTFVGKRPQTTAAISKKGKQRFLEYIETLEAVLQEAAAKLKTEQEQHNEQAIGLDDATLVRA